jgi:hypothetical protein
VIARAASAFALALLALACETRVVDLDVPDGAGGAPTMCEGVRREDGSLCRLCSTAGTIVSSSCEKPPVEPPEAGTCKELPGEPRCLTCLRAGASYDACLRCGPLTKTVTGQACRLCTWSDTPKLACEECFGPDGRMTLDECTQQRREMIYGGEPVKAPSPPPAP